MAMKEDVRKWEFPNGAGVICGCPVGYGRSGLLPNSSTVKVAVLFSVYTFRPFI
jgi:hypothetical protein